MALEDDGNVYETHRGPTMSEPDFITQARREGRILVDRGVNQNALPGLEAAEPGSVFEATLPLGPSINHYWRHRIATPKGGVPFIAVYISAEGEAFKDAVALLVKQGRHKAMTGPLSLSVVVHPKDARSIDVDNRIKPLADAMQAAGLVANDSQFEEVYARKGPIRRPDGMMIVRIVPLSEPA